MALVCAVHTGAPRQFDAMQTCVCSNVFPDLYAFETLSTPAFVSLLPATDEHSDSVQGVVPFTLLLLVLTQNFSLHNPTNSIYGLLCTHSRQNSKKGLFFRNDLIPRSDLITYDMRSERRLFFLQDLWSWSFFCDLVPSTVQQQNLCRFCFL